jgi:uncharacterized protein (TIGR02145 family)
MKNMFKISSLILLILLIYSCKKDKPTPPTVITTAISEFTATTAKSGGTISADGGAAIITCGVCWSKAGEPTIEDQKTTDAIAAGSFTSNIANLEGGTVYYVRAYATNSAGTGYGTAMSFTTLGQVPTSINSAVTNITATGATLNGTVNANFLSTIVTFEYGTSTDYGQSATASQSPVTGNTTTNVSANITGLTSGTTYHLRIKAVNPLGTTYSNDIIFTTTTATVTDIDGNTYLTIKIGTQLWMAENLKTTKYNDGTAIPNITDNATWAALTTGAYSDYSNTPANSTTYGRLYNWCAVDNNVDTRVVSNGGKNVCPTSWHVPTDTEWTTLTTFLGGEGGAGGKLKETGTTHWASPNSGATNETGFTALPGGFRSDSGANDQMKIFGHWWCSTGRSTSVAWGRSMYYMGALVDRSDFHKQDGLSVRCVRDN